MGVPLRYLDILRVDARGSVSPAPTLRVVVRIQKPNGDVVTLEFIATVSTDRTASQTDRRVEKVYEGEIVSACIFVQSGTTPKRGVVYASLELQTQDNIAQVYLCSGYVADREFPTYPYLVPPGPTGGRGNIRSITGTNPAAGVEMSEAVPTNAMWRLISLRVVIVGGAVAFTPEFQVTDGTTDKWRSPPITVTAATTEVMVLAEHGAFLEGSTSFFAFPRDFYLPEAYVVRTANITVDDDYGAPEFVVEEWLVV